MYFYIIFRVFASAVECLAKGRLTHVLGFSSLSGRSERKRATGCEMLPPQAENQGKAAPEDPTPGGTVSCM